MNYFTPAWCNATPNLEDDTPDDYEPFYAYKRHLAECLPLLPPEVRTLAAIDIQDGLLRKAVDDEEKETLVLVLRCGDLQVGYFDLELQYGQVDFSPELRGNLATLIKNPKGDDYYNVYRRSEAMWQEVDIEGTFFVHRILFISRGDYQEFAVRFWQLNLRRVPREGRHDASDGVTHDPAVADSDEEE